MQADGRGWLYVPTGLADGPMPTHYEPQDSPFENLLYAQQRNPVRQVVAHPNNRYHPIRGEPGAEVFPYVITTYRLTEHFTAGGMTRWTPYLSELQPEFFCEVSPELAAERELLHGGWATIVTARNAIEARVLVTDRMRPITVQGKVLHQIGLPFHWGPNGYSRGDAANELSAIALDPNSHIQEVKAMTADIRPGRRPRGAAREQLVQEYMPPRRHHGEDRDGGVSAALQVTVHGLNGAQDPAGDAGYEEHPQRVGFFTDTSLCIGCKACEVACKEWNQVPEDGLNFTGMSFDNTEGLSADSWRHVAFIEQRRPMAAQETNLERQPDEGFRWLMASDVCKHCTHAACLDVCPTGALFRTEFGTVVVQQDICNGCGYCVPACPFGVIGKRAERTGGCGSARSATTGSRAGHGTCLRQGLPDQLDPVRRARRAAHARRRTRRAAAAGRRRRAQLYGHDPGDGVGGDGAFFLLLDRARGLRAAARPGRDHPRSPAHVAKRRDRRRRARRRRRRELHPGAAMTSSDVTVDGISGARPDREALTGFNQLSAAARDSTRRRPRGGRGPGRRGRGEQTMVERPSSRATTAGRSSRNRPGRRLTSAATSSSAGSPGPPPRWPQAHS